MAITVKTAAKLNLSLDITGLTRDGFHSLSTVMQSVSLYDYITLSAAESGISLRGNLPYIPYNEKNLVHKAASAFYEASGIPPGIEIRLVKHIPVQAGMGGGSGNAAGVLAALNALYGEPLGRAALMDAAAALGSDVPFFLEGGTVLCEGRGEKMTPLSPVPDCRFVIVKNREGVSTREAFGAYDAAGKRGGESTPALIRAIDSGDIAALGRALGNDFEPIVSARCSSVASARKTLESYAPAGVCMTGSGSAVFAVFPDAEAAQACLAAVSKKHRFAFIAEPCAQGYILIKEDNRK